MFVNDCERIWGWRVSTIKDDIKDLIAANRQAVSHAEFWIVYQLGAFQLAPDRDRDPDTEGWSMGESSMTTVPATGDKAGTVIFLEVIKDKQPDAAMSFDSLRKVISLDAQLGDLMFFR